MGVYLVSPILSMESKDILLDCQFRLGFHNIVGPFFE